MLGVLSAIAEVAMGSGPFNPKKASFQTEKAGSTIVLKLPHMFNPTDLKVARKVSWKCAPTQDAEGAKGAPFYVFGGGGDNLSFSMVFDCSEEVEASLTTELEGLYDLTYPFTEYTKADGKKGTRAQIVRFAWESFVFLGVIDSVDITVTLFDPSGRIKRATVAIAMQGHAFTHSDGIDELKFRTEPRADKTAPKYESGGTLSTAASGGGLAGTLAKFGI